MVDFRINWTLCTGEGTIWAMTPVGAVYPRTASAQLETLLAIPIYRGAPTKRGDRKCQFIFMTYYNFSEISAAIEYRT